MKAADKFKKCEGCPNFKLGAEIGDYVLQPLCLRDWDGNNEYDAPKIYHVECE